MCPQEPLHRCSQISLPLSRQIPAKLVQQLLVRASRIERDGPAGSGLPEDGKQLEQTRTRAASFGCRRLVRVRIDHCLGDIPHTESSRGEPSAKGAERYPGSRTLDWLQNTGVDDQVQGGHTSSPVSYEPTGENTKLCRMR
jgi:hypothetical protein